MDAAEQWMDVPQVQYFLLLIKCDLITAIFSHIISQLAEDCYLFCMLSRSQWQC